MLTPHQGARHWQEQYPTQGCPFEVPPFQNDWALAASTPPWFTARVWHWASKQQWDECPADSCGTTSLELLLDFVITTGSCPPVRSSGPEASWIELLLSSRIAGLVFVAHQVRAPIGKVFWCQTLAGQPDQSTYATAAGTGYTTQRRAEGTGLA